MVTFKESFTAARRRDNRKMIIDMNKRMVCKMLFDNTHSNHEDSSRIYILSTTTNPFLFTFKTI
jgi:hypothetical protein